MITKRKVLEGKSVHAYEIIVLKHSRFKYIKDGDNIFPKCDSNVDGGKKISDYKWRNHTL